MGRNQTAAWIGKQAFSARLEQCLPTSMRGSTEEPELNESLQKTAGENHDLSNLPEL
jgi:hypothetical protein